MKYAIKYLKIKYDTDTYLLVPKQLVKGELKDNFNFEVNGKEIPYINNVNQTGYYVIADALSIDELRHQYEVSEDEMSDEELAEYYFIDQLNNIYILSDDKRISINTSDLFDNSTEKTLYDSISGESSLIFNKRIFDILESIDDINELKNILREHYGRLQDFDIKRATNGLERIKVEDGHVVDICMSKEMPNKVEKKFDVITNDEEISKNDFSVNGLYNYLKSHIIGHDQELKKIATILYMNYTSNPIYGTESILVPGPTGTGKTTTFDVAAKYFNVPFRNINTCNLVPEGIEGTTVEDEFSGLIDSCEGDIAQAEKAILVFDEFDKLGKDGLDIKSSLVNVFLKILEGGRFPINRQLRQTRVYNTTMATKIALGTFEEARDVKKNNPIGFTSQSNDNIIYTFNKDTLIENGYFSKELLTRFQHFIPYGYLTEEDKKKIILESKLSKYLSKKQRLKTQFGIDIKGDEEFANGVIEALNKNDKSIRDLNNLISDFFLDIEYAILENNERDKKLILTSSSIKDRSFDII